ncbi:hypothetical protein, partial [Desulfosporosinus fructosivorans]|uniref:hypothetical protein n=1 Tax=Desulfosporosinus fructosivorans TaxID=2018669 RepID=UPI001A7E2EC9
VKTSRADDTWGASPWESRSSPGKHAKSYLLGDSFFVLSYTVIWGRGSTRSSTLLELASWVAVWRKARPPFVSRTRKLRPPGPMILGAQAPGKVGHRQVNMQKAIS